MQGLTFSGSKIILKVNVIPKILQLESGIYFRGLKYEEGDCTFTTYGKIYMVALGEQSPFPPGPRAVTGGCDEGRAHATKWAIALNLQLHESPDPSQNFY